MSASQLNRIIIMCIHFYRQHRVPDYCKVVESFSVPKPIASRPATFSPVGSARSSVIDRLCVTFSGSPAFPLTPGCVRQFGRVPDPRPVQPLLHAHPPRLWHEETPHAEQPGLRSGKTTSHTSHDTRPHFIMDLLIGNDDKVAESG